jgi:hypothetical protein
VLGTIPPTTLEKLRALRAQRDAAQARMDEMMTVLVEAHGHDLARVVKVQHLDLGAGRYVLAMADEAAA